MRLIPLAVAVLAVTFAGVAFAQDIVPAITAVSAADVVVPVQPTSWWQVLVAQFQAPLLLVMTAVITAATGFVGTYAKRYLGEKAAEVLMNIFQTSAQNAAAWLIAKIGLPAAQALKPGDPLIAEAVRTQIDQSIPGTLKKLGNPHDKLKADKVISWIQKIAIGGLTGGIPGAVAGAVRR